jgi:hypothetical protein
MKNETNSPELPQRAASWLGGCWLMVLMMMKMSFPWCCLPCRVGLMELPCKLRFELRFELSVSFV